MARKKKAKKEKKEAKKKAEDGKKYKIPPVKVVRAAVPAAGVV